MIFSIMNDRFSWARTLSIAGMYRSGIRKHLIICICAVLACYALMALIASVTSKSLAIYGLLSTLLSFYIYTSPIVFAGRDRSLMGQLPVLPSEKLAFYTIYSFIVIPFVVEGLWFLLSWIGSFFLPIGNLYGFMKLKALTESQVDITNPELVFSTITNVITCAAMIGISMWIVFTKHNNCLIKCILSALGFLLGIGFISGIFGIVAGFSDAWNGIDRSPEYFHSSEYFKEIINYMKYFCGILNIVFIGTLILILRKLYIRFKYPQIEY